MISSMLPHRVAYVSGRYSSVKLRVEAKKKLKELQLKLKLRGIKAKSSRNT